MIHVLYVAKEFPRSEIFCSSNSLECLTSLTAAIARASSLLWRRIHGRHQERGHEGILRAAKPRGSSQLHSLLHWNKELASTIPTTTQAIVSNYDLFQEMTLTSASCACVVSMQALEGFALASHILIVLSTEHDANTWQTKKIQYIKHNHRKLRDQNATDLHESNAVKFTHGVNEILWWRPWFYLCQVIQGSYYCSQKRRMPSTG